MRRVRRGETAGRGQVRKACSWLAVIYCAAGQRAAGSAECFAKDAYEGACHAEGTAFISVSEVRCRGAAVLATEVLRFQRVQLHKEERKTGVHARESGGTRARETSEGLAVEQFSLLRERGSRISGD